MKTWKQNNQHIRRTEVSETGIAFIRNTMR